MQITVGRRPRNPRPRSGPARFVPLAAHESSTADLLHGCPVVTASGQRVGIVDRLMIDVVTHQLRYVVLARKRGSAIVALPWHALYFDAAQSKLVFYTLG